MKSQKGVLFTVRKAKGAFKRSKRVLELGHVVFQVKVSLRGGLGLFMRIQCVPINMGI